MHSKKYSSRYSIVQILLDSTSVLHDLLYLYTLMFEVKGIAPKTNLKAII
jgi:hypothetical protein